MTIAIVQQTAQAQGAAVPTLQTAAFGLPVTAGNTIIVGIVGFGSTIGGSGNVTVTDNKSNGYVLDAGEGLNPARNDSFVAFFRASNVIGGSAFKVTASLASGGAYMNIVALEVSGLTNVSPTDGTATAAGSTDPAKSGALTTTNASDLVFAGFSDGDGGSVASFPPAGYTQFNQETSAATYEIGDMAYAIVSSIQTAVNLSFSTSGATDWVGCAVAYKGTGGGGSSSVPLPLAAPGAMGVGACPFGYTNQMRRNRVEGVRFKHGMGR